MTHPHDEWAPPTPSPAPVFPRELRIWSLSYYARFGVWPSPLADHPIPEDLQAIGERARAFYLSTVRPVEESSNWSEWGLVPPAGVSPRPIFAPFVPAPHSATATSIPMRSDPRGTSHAMRVDPESSDHSGS
jgi:hypothetical protein